MESPFKPQRKRRSAPKVRSGCLTCKIRRIKCDEARPLCTRCVQSSMTCDGYTVKSAFIKFISVRPLAISIPPAPSGDLYLDEQEMRYFQDFVQDRFIDSRRKSLSSSRKFLVTDTFFWSGIVLQEGHSTPCTRHAIVAISALVRSLHHHWQEHFDAPDTTDPHHEFALLQYQKALRNLRTAILIPDDVNGPRVALVACLVLAFFDMLYGHGTFAARHMEYGRQILFKWRRKNRSPGLQLDPIPQSVDNISRLFLRLDLQATYLIGSRQQPSYAGLDVEKLPMKMPAKFASMNEARYIGHLLVSKAGNFRLQTMDHEHSQQLIPPKIAERRQYFLQQFRLFHKAAVHLLQGYPTQDSKDIHPLARPEALNIFPTAMWMRLTPGWGSPQTACDALIEHFEYMVFMARDIIEYEGKTNKGAAAFCFEYRILPFLFFVASKCRDPILRRKAIALMLSAHWREGIWDSFLGGKMATWIMEMEEEGMDEDGFIPETARCFGETFALDMATKTASVRCWQNVMEEKGAGCVERKTTIKW